jgi:hypothetical protein
MIRILLTLALACFSLSADAQFISFPTYFRTFTPTVLYHIDPAGHDTCNGLGTSNGTINPCAWLTMNHAVNCGDVLLAATGAYNSGLGTSGAVSNCPSTAGGIDGAGGIYFAIVLCAGQLNTCTSNTTGSFANITTSNWAVEGFVHTPSSGTPTSFLANGVVGSPIHHSAFINDIATGTGFGFGAQGQGSNFTVPGNTSTDYVAYIGNIAQNASKNTACSAAMVIVGPSTFNSNAGTHFMMYGNFSYYQPTNGCGTDEENYMFDSFDVHQVTNQAVMLNNMGWSAWRMGVQVFFQNNHTLSSSTFHYILNNTEFNNSLIGTAGQYGEINIQQNNAGGPNVIVENNVTKSTATVANCGLLAGATGGGTVANIILGTTGNENVAYQVTSPSTDSVCVFNGISAGTNFKVDPTFNNTSDLLTNWTTTATTCSNFDNTTACMGYNAKSRALSTNTPIYDLTPTCGNCSGKGYQLPSTTCSPNGINAPDGTALYPTWLKGIVYLHWNATASQIEQHFDLVTLPCGL